MGREDDVRLYPIPYFVAYTAKCCQTFFRCPRCCGRVRESPMEPYYSAGKYGARLVGVVANGDDKSEDFSQQGIHMFGLVFRNIDADLCHDRDGVRMDAPWFRTGAVGLPLLPVYGAEQTFGHLGAAGIMGAKKKGGFFVHFWWMLSHHVYRWRSLVAGVSFPRMDTGKNRETVVP